MGQKNTPADAGKGRTMKIRKGDYGYISRQKLTRFLKTILFFLLPLAFFIVGYVLNNGDRMNIYTVIAIVGCIPACMSAVGMIMMWMRKPMRRELYEEISSHAGDVAMAYELYLTTRDKNLFLDAVAVCGEYVTAYADRDVPHGGSGFHGGAHPENPPGRPSQSHGEDLRPQPEENLSGAAGHPPGTAGGI